MQILSTTTSKSHARLGSVVECAFNATSKTISYATVSATEPYYRAKNGY
jgi:hypothetical protein